MEQIFKLLKRINEEQEIKTKIENYMKKNNIDNYKDLFNHFDNDNNKSIDKDELKIALKNMNLGNGFTRPIYVKTIIDKYDLNKDNMISCDEFNQFINLE